VEAEVRFRVQRVGVRQGTAFLAYVREMLGRAETTGRLVLRANGFEHRSITPSRVSG
jgi:hypothetical protein